MLAKNDTRGGRGRGRADSLLPLVVAEDGEGSLQKKGERWLMEQLGRKGTMCEGMRTSARGVQRPQVSPSAKAVGG